MKGKVTFSFVSTPPPPRATHSTHRSIADSYLCEFMWRQQNKGKDLFEEIINVFVKYNPLC